jgi:TonB family protein
MIRILASTAMLLAVAAMPAAAQTGDTRAHVDLTKSHVVVYPDGFEESGEQGTVTLDVGVGTDGLVTHVKVAKTSGYRDLDVAASETAMNWKYVPASHDGDVHPDDIMLKVVYDRPDASAPAH